MGRKTVNFLEDEEISNCVKNFPCLYDKADSFYKEKRAKKMLGKESKKSLDWKKIYKNTLLCHKFI